MEGKNSSLALNTEFSIQQRVRALVEDEGLVCLGFVSLEEEIRFETFDQWLADKKHGEMTYLENYRELRKHPERILPGAKSAVIIGYPYYQGDRYRFTKSKMPRIAQYARFSDYHKVLKKKCERVLNELLTLLPSGNFGRVLVDSAPILERALAEKTLNGFVGKNTMFIHPQWGSYLLLSEIFLSVPLVTVPSAPSKTCGTCQRCQVYCPTGALTPYGLDATKCLAYYTIEHRGTIPVKYWPFLKEYVFGCDICQLVCPFNRKVELAGKLAIKLSEFPPLHEAATMDSAYYERVFGGTPMTRAKRSGLRRNALIAMIVSDDERLEETILKVQSEGDLLLKETLAQIPEYKRFIDVTRK